MTGTFSRADSCRSVTKCFIWGQTFVDVLISLISSIHLYHYRQTLIWWSFSFSFLPWSIITNAVEIVVSTFNSCAAKVFRIMPCYLNDIHHRHSSKSWILNTSQIFKNNIENIKVIFLNNRFLVDAVESNLIPNLLHICYRTFGQVFDRWLAVHLVF